MASTQISLENEDIHRAIQMYVRDKYDVEILASTVHVRNGFDRPKLAGATVEVKLKQK